MSAPIPWDELSPEAQDAVRAGRKIDAIRLLREARGLGLKEAKDVIDAHFEAHGPPRTPRGCLVLALAPLAAWLAQRLG